MKVWIDVTHIAQLNFYSNVIKNLSLENEVLFTVINRGKLYKIAQKEFDSVQNCKIIKLGKHSGNKFSAIFDANFIRLFSMLFFYLKYRPQVSVGNSFLHGIISKIFWFPSLMFGDDIERKSDVFLKTLFSKEIYYFTGGYADQINKKIVNLKALKEWAYLSPNYFKPNVDILKNHDLEENQYIFVREVITGTLNYNNQSSDLIATIANKFPKGLKVVLSLEDKSKIDSYPKDWLLLNEPIDDIHSLIYYSRILISSGDSMAREGAVLGVPSIYCGIREMNANKIMIAIGGLFHIDINDVPNQIEELLKLDKNSHQVKITETLEKEWDDPNKIILNRINYYKK